jgi:uncharacterized membrane protein YfcA
MTVCWIAALGVCIGVGSGLLGAGGSILTVLLFVHLAGLPMSSAISTSLVVVGAMSVVALVPYSRAGAVRWKAGAVFSLASAAGAFLGGHVSAWLPARALLVIFALTMAVAAVAMLWNRPLPPAGARASKKALLAMAAAGLPLGGLTGVVGLGGGFAILPILIVCAGTPVRAAVGTTLFVVTVNTLAGLAGHFPHPAIDWRLACYVGLAASAGSLAGARLAERIDANILRRAFGAILLAMAVGLLGGALRSSWPLAHQRERPRHDVVDRETVLLQDQTARRGRAEAIDRQDVPVAADPALPA